MLRLAPALTLALLLGPIGVGLLWTLLPAFGYLPAIGAHEPSLQGWRDLLGFPGFATSLRLTLTAGIGATAASLLLAAGFCAVASVRPSFRAAERLLAPLLGSPHAAIALGFAFVIAPSGFVARLLSPELTGWERPPTGVVTLQDPLGLSFLAGLLLKEVPYLVLMILGASAQVPVRATLAASRSLGVLGQAAWVKAVFPQIYPQIRLPVYAVLAFSLSAVDVGLILAPGNPPPLAVLAARWFADYDLALYLPAAAAATLQLVIVLAAVVLWRLGEIAAARLGRLWIERGSRGEASVAALTVAGAAAGGVGILGLGSLAVMGLWSFAGAWRFPDAWPESWSAAIWVAEAPRIAATVATTAAIGFMSTMVAVLLSLACLENEARRGMRPGSRALWLLYAPLLVPQIAFLFGVQIALVRLNLDGTHLAVAWTHLVFVLPYVFLSLADPYRAFDPHYARSAAALGASRARVFLTLKLPMLLRPILIAAAVGFAVSVGQYLATLFPGAGRIATLTTEAVTLAGGSDRRIVGATAVLQAALPLLVYGAALLVPHVIFRRRRGLL
jgi:putative thiamine transport system permease protein